MSRSPRETRRRKVRDVFSRFGSSVNLQPSDEEDEEDPTPARKQAGQRGRDLVRLAKAQVQNWSDRAKEEPESSSGESGRRKQLGFPRGRRTRRTRDASFLMATDEDERERNNSPAEARRAAKSRSPPARRVPRVAPTGGPTRKRSGSLDANTNRRFPRRAPGLLKKRNSTTSLSKDRGDSKGLTISPSTSHSLLSDVEKSEKTLKNRASTEGTSRDSGEPLTESWNAEFTPRFSGMGFDTSRTHRNSGRSPNPEPDSQAREPKSLDQSRLAKAPRRRRSWRKSPNRADPGLKPDALRRETSDLEVPLEALPTGEQLLPSGEELESRSLDPSPRVARRVKRRAPSQELKRKSPGFKKSPQNEAMRQKLHKEMLPDLSPDRGNRTISTVRKMIEGFIDAASTKAEIEIPRSEAKTASAEVKAEFNVEIAARRLVVMAHRNDWIAFEQALKAIERQTDPALVEAIGEGEEAGEATPTPLKDIHDPSTGNTLLMFAVIDNRINLMERIIDLGCDVNARNHERYTALHMASMYSREDTIKWLLSHKSDVGAIGGLKQQTCVHLAAARQNAQAYQVLKELLKHCPKEVRMKPDADGNIPLFVAIEFGNFNMCRELVSTDTEDQIQRLKMPLMDTCLHLAARKGDSDLLKLFIEFGANVDAINRDGQTVLHIAALNGDENIVRNLFMARANPTIKDNEDRTAIHLAAERGHTKTVEFLAEKFKSNVYDRARDGSTLMHLAALHGHSDTAMVLFKKGVPLLMPNRFGARSIHTAAMRGHVSVISTLVQKGENVDCTTNDNYTALHLAVEAGKATVVEALLGHGANVHIKGGKIGETALHIASRIDEIRGEKCTRMLLKSGADPNLAMADGRTALHVAAENGTVTNTRFLLQNGADVMLVDSEGETSLHKAAKSCHQPTVREILDFIAKALGDCTDFVQKQNKIGETALHQACKVVKGNLHFKDEDIILIRTLMEFKSSATIQTVNTRESAMHYVSTAGNADILEELLNHMHAGQIQLAVNQQSATGWSPLCFSASRGHVKVTHILLEHNARVDVFDHEGKSSLHLAAEIGSSDVCQLLVRKKAFVNSRTKNGWTALHYGAQKGHAQMVRILVEKYAASVDALTMKKQTPLHLAALSGKLDMCRLLIELGASMDSADEMGQKPIHMAATSDKPEVILLFLEARPSLVSSATKDGSTCAHIAAKRGSAMVIKELMKFDKSVVLSSKNKITDSASIHIAAEGGHRDVVKMLLEAGCAADEENKSGFTPTHIAAKFGHTTLIEELANHGVNMREVSRKNGMTALHIAAFFGETETTRELLTHIPAQSKSNFPAAMNLSLAREIHTECDLTPLHVASFTGAENVVRVLLNYAGVNVESQSSPSGYIPLHLACISGHVGVVGLLLSRTTTLLKNTDTKGRTCLHVAARSGHYDMVQVLIGQGADHNVQDSEGWLALHHAANSGHLDVVQLLVESGTSPNAETLEKKIPLWYAAKQGNFTVVQYLLRREHSTDRMLADKKFVFNLMVVGKSNKFKSIEDFVFVSPAPCFTAANLSALYRDMALKEKDRAADLIAIGDVCEELAKDLVGIAANMESPGRILNSLDQGDVNFIDTLIESEQKLAISQYVVQQYLQEIWEGHLNMKAWQFVLFFLLFLFVPPVWFFFSVPLARGYNKVPVVKFMSYLTSHLYLMAFLTLASVVPPDPTTRDSLFPFWYEIATWIWYLGLFLDRITNPGTKGGLSWVKYLLVALGIGSVLVHGSAFFMDSYWWSLIMYIRNMFFASSLLFATVLILDYLSFHHLFGPWAIIIGELLLDVGKFVVVLSLFILGFSLLTSAMNNPFGFPDEYPDETNTSLKEKIAQNSDITHPVLMFELLFFALFGLNNADSLRVSSLIQPWTRFTFKIVFASYLLLTVVVLINLLIAMMSDTYQRIQQQSDIEWKFGLAKLTRNMQRTQVAPSPLNLITTWMVLAHSWCVRGRNERQLARKKFRQAMKDEIMHKAPGMKFVLDVSDKKRRLTPRVIHALGNIKWGFTDGTKPIPVDVIQSKWDREHRHDKTLARSMNEVDEFVLTSRAVNWAQVIRRYLSLNGRENELKDAHEDEADVKSVMKSLVDIRNDGVQGARQQAVKWTKIPGETKKQVIEKWEEKARL